jgi:long-chain acyl-CoA synthetase
MHKKIGGLSTPSRRGGAMYPGVQAKIHPHQPAFIMARTGETVSYAELERRSIRLAHFLRAAGLGRLDHYATFMETTPAMSNAAVPANRPTSITPASTPI